jgi:hypothetical protein
MNKPINIDDLPEFVDDETYSPAMHTKNPEKESVPDELTALLEELGQVKEFSVTVQRITESGREHCGKMVNVLPDTEEIGVKFGPGNYRLTISWPVPGKKTPLTKPLNIRIGKEYAIRHRKWMEEESAKLETRPQTGSDNFSFLLDAASKMVGMMRPSDNNSGILEIVRMQSEQTTKMIDRLERTISDDRKENNSKFEKMLGAFETVVSRISERKEKPFLEQLKEIKEMAGVLGMSPVAGMISHDEIDDRPDWMKAIDMIGDKIGPLLSAFAQGGIKGTIAAQQVKPALNSELGQRILNDHKERVAFMEGMIDKATTPEQRQGVLKMAERLKIPLPPEIIARVNA